MKSPKIECACRCGTLIPSRALNGEKQFYAHGHNRHVFGKPVNDGGGYKAVLCHGHPFADKDGYVRLHRIILESYWFIKYKRPFFILPYFAVHHINGNKDDNRPENLMMIEKREHTRIHKFDPTIDDRICKRCNRGQVRGRMWKKLMDGYLCANCWTTIRERIYRHIRIFMTNYF